MLYFVWGPDSTCVSVMSTISLKLNLREGMGWKLPICCTFVTTYGHSLHTYRTARWKWVMKRKASSLDWMGEFNNSKNCFLLVLCWLLCPLVWLAWLLGYISLQAGGECTADLSLIYLLLYLLKFKISFFSPFNMGGGKPLINTRVGVRQNLQLWFQAQEAQNTCCLWL